ARVILRRGHANILAGCPKDERFSCPTIQLSWELTSPGIMNMHLCALLCAAASPAAAVRRAHLFRCRPRLRPRQKSTPTLFGPCPAGEDIVSPVLATFMFLGPRADK